MSLRFAYVLLFSVCAFGLGIAAPAFPVDEKCGLNAEYITCGSACPLDCANPVPSKLCTRQCVVGCFCKEGYLKNAKGVCVRLHECEARHHDIHIQIPAAPTCPANEVFLSCGTACPATCANPQPSPVCTKNCVIGCFCKEGFLRNAKGVCVETRQCESSVSNQLFAYPPELTQCKDNEFFNPCGSACPATCANPHPSPVCTKNCVIGCVCQPGFLKNNNGICVQSAKCDAPASDIIPIQPQVCKDDNEEFRQCKGCDGTCTKPNPLCPRICIPGCACKQGHVRSENGKCIESRECTSQVKPESFMMPPPIPPCGSNAIFLTCGTACPATCAHPHPSPICTMNCVIGCFCTEGYLKNAQGVCVAATKC